MEKLSAAETGIIRELLIAEFGPESPLLQQLARARVTSRQLTGVGVYVNLAVPETNRGGLNTELSKDFRTTLAAPCDLVGFTLFIRDGQLSFLEGCTFGDVKWPAEPIEDWLVFDPAPVRAK